MKSAPKTTVTLEDLLRLKRAEQPPAEFWGQFEQELRAKQLAAIVEPRPWWAPFIRLGARMSHLQLPVGAAAILVVSFVTVREYRAPEVGSIYLPEIAVQEVAAGRTAVLWEESPRPAQEMPVVAVNLSEYSSEQSGDMGLTQTLASTASIARPAEVVSSVEMEREPSPSERYIAANLAAAQAADPGLMDDVFGPSKQRVQHRQPMRDPLAQLSAPGESRRARLLATALPVNAGSSDVVVGASDRVARDLTEQRLYDTISRVGLKGDRVAIKF